MKTLLIFLLAMSVAVAHLDAQAPLADSVALFYYQKGLSEISEDKDVMSVGAINSFYTALENTDDASFQILIKSHLVEQLLINGRKDAAKYILDGIHVDEYMSKEVKYAAYSAFSRYEEATDYIKAIETKKKSRQWVLAEKLHSYYYSLTELYSHTIYKDSTQRYASLLLNELDQNHPKARNYYLKLSQICNNVGLKELSDRAKAR